MAKRRLKKAPTTKEKRQVKSRWTTWALVGGAAVVLGLMITFFIMQSSPKATSAGAHTGDAAPNFTLPLLNGNSVTLASLKGKPVLLNFWAST